MPAENSKSFPKMSFLTIVLNGMPFIELALRAIYDFAHEIVVAEGAVESCMFAANWDGSSKDGTVECIKKFPDPEKKIKLVQGVWPEKVDMENRAFEMISGDYVWTFGSDEVYRREDIVKVINLIRERPEITQINFIPDNFWKGFDYIFVSKIFLEPDKHYKRVFKFVPDARFSEHRPPRFMWPHSQLSTEEMNLVSGFETKEMGIRLHHYSYVLDEQVKQKVELYRRYGWGKMWDLDLNEWYEECFRKWTPKNRKVIEEKYPVWTGDRKSHTEKFTGAHPGVMRQYIENFRGALRKGNGDGITEDRVRQIIGAPLYQKKVLKAYELIELDEPIRQRKETMKLNVKEEKPFWNLHVALAFLATKLEPESYLEVGVRTGGSLVQVLYNSAVQDVVGMDTWIKDYAGLPNSLSYAMQQIERFQRNTRKKFRIEYIGGDSHAKLKDLIETGRTFDLITVDGDRSESGAWQDLEECLQMLGDKGAIVFDDIIHHSFPYTLDLVYRLKDKYSDLKLLINKEQDNGCAIFLKNVNINDLLLDKKATSQKPTKIKVASDYVQEGAKIGEESEFRTELKRLFSGQRFSKIIETGTYLGTGTTTIIATALRDLGIENFKFYSIEINPLHLQAAVNHLRKSGLIDYVTLLNGLSVPKKLLPSIEEIEQKYVKDIDFDDIFIDHKESERALLYYQETNFEDLPDDQLREALKSFSYEPDFILLDSGGHMGNIEFNYLINLLRSGCYIALDDIYHIKHHKSFLQIKDDQRFTVVAESSDKFGFCIAKFSPEIAVDNRRVKSILWVRTDNIGDNILSASMLPYIRYKFDEAKITVVCQEGAAELYEGCPLVDEIVRVNKQRAYQDEAYRNDIVRQLNELTPDLALNSVYSREPINDLLAIAPKAKERIAFSGNLCNISQEIRDGHDPLYSKLLTSDRQHKLEIERHKDFLAGTGIESGDLRPLVWTTDEDEAFAEELFREKKLIPERTIALFAGVQYAVRSYNRYGLALSKVFRGSEFAVIGLGSEADLIANEKNLAASEMAAINLSGKTTLRQTAALLRKCRLAVGAETGLAHMACAVGTPNVILLGGGHFGRFMPYSALTTVVCLPLACYGCDWRCKCRRVYCVKNVRDDVFADGIREALSQVEECPRVVVQGRSLWNVLNGAPKWQSFEKVLNPQNVRIIEVQKDSLPSEGKHIRVDKRSSKISGKSTYETSLKRHRGRRIERNGNLTRKARNADAKKGNGSMESSISTFASAHREDEFKRYKVAVERDPNDPICQKNLADFYYVVKEDIESALEHYSRAMSSNPKDIDTLLMLGHISVQKRRFEEAAVFYNKVIEIDPENQDAARILNKLTKTDV